MDLALALVGLVVVAVALLSNALKRSLVQQPMLVMLVGVAAGPYGFGLLDVAAWGDENRILEQAARITLAIGLMGVALRLHRQSISSILRPVGVLLTVVMVGMWLVASAIAGWLLGLPMWMALLVGAVITPTDPVVASSIVTGPFAKEHLPQRLRDSISMESGANDGLAYLFVMLPILVIGGSSDPLARWLTESVLVGVVGGAALGVAIGFGAARLLMFAEEHKLIERASFLGYTLAFSLATLGIAALLHADALISVFLAGLVFNLTVGQREEHEEENIQEAVAKVFTLPMFVIFGAAVPLPEWIDVGLPLAALAVLVILVRRPPVIALVAPALRGALSGRDVAYVGWFGPIGIAAIYYAAFARTHVPEPMIWYAASAVIFASIVIHGLTAAPFTRMYARRRSTPATADR